MLSLANINSGTTAAVRRQQSAHLPEPITTFRVFSFSWLEHCASFPFHSFFFPPLKKKKQKQNKTLYFLHLSPAGSLDVLIHFKASLFLFCLSDVQHFSGGSGGKESSWNTGDPGSIPGLGRSPWRREQLLTPVFLPRESPKQRSLAGYSP